jgi:hypothetical protein
MRWLPRCRRCSRSDRDCTHRVERSPRSPPRGCRARVRHVRGRPAECRPRAERVGPAFDPTRETYGERNVPRCAARRLRSAGDGPHDRLGAVRARLPAAADSARWAVYRRSTLDVMSGSEIAAKLAAAATSRVPATAPRARPGRGASFPHRVATQARPPLAERSPAPSRAGSSLPGPRRLAGLRPPGHLKSLSSTGHSESNVVGVIEPDDLRTAIAESDDYDDARARCGGSRAPRCSNPSRSGHPDGVRPLGDGPRDRRTSTAA